MCLVAKKARTRTTEAIFVKKLNKDFKNGPHQKTKQQTKKSLKDQSKEKMYVARSRRVSSGDFQ